jgi:uncharacterized protein
MMEITVVGTDEYSVPPERGTARLDVGCEGGDLAEVVNASTRLVNALNDHLDQLRTGVTGFVTWHAVSPLGTRSWRPFNNQGNVLPMRHAANAHIQAKFRDFAALARFAADWGARDGVRLSHVEWTVTEQRRAELESAILAGAVRDARRRAVIIARAAGAEGVEVVEVADPGLLSGTRGQQSAGPLPPAAFRSAAGIESGDAAAIVPEDVTGSATVHARFRTAAAR